MLFPGSPQSVTKHSKDVRAWPFLCYRRPPTNSLCSKSLHWVDWDLVWSVALSEVLPVQFCCPSLLTSLMSDPHHGLKSSPALVCFLLLQPDSRTLESVLSCSQKQTDNRGFIGPQNPYNNVSLVVPHLKGSTSLRIPVRLWDCETQRALSCWPGRVMDEGLTAATLSWFLQLCLWRIKKIAGGENVFQKMLLIYFFLNSDL